MNLFEKLNRLDDSLVESKRVVKKKKLTESYFDEMTEFMNWIQEYRNGALWDAFAIEFDAEQDPDMDVVLDWLEMFDETAYYDYIDDTYDDDIDEMLTENRNNPYFAPYGYRDAAKVLNGKAPQYYWHLKEIEMDRGDGIKLARYAMKKGLPVMVNKKSDPDYPEFAIKGEYHWNDYFYPYPTAHEEDLVAWDGKMFVEEQLTEGNNVSSQLPPAVDNFLQDIAQMYKTITYKDIMGHEYTEEDLKKLKNYRRRFRAEIPYEGDEEADAILNDIAEKVGRLIKNTSLAEGIADKFEQDINRIFTEHPELKSIKYNTSFTNNGICINFEDSKDVTIQKALNRLEKEGYKITIPAREFDGCIIVTK